eukprot:768781-Hanusia_phi.AAC.21
MVTVTSESPNYRAVPPDQVSDNKQASNTHPQPHGHQVSNDQPYYNSTAAGGVSSRALPVSVAEFPQPGRLRRSQSVRWIELGRTNASRVPGRVTEPLRGRSTVTPRSGGPGPGVTVVINQCAPLHPLFGL